MKFTFENIHYDGPIATRWEVLLRIVGDFSILVGQRALYEEVEFCLVEFAVQLAFWLGRLGPDASDFKYTSMESDVDGLVSLAKCAPDRWRVVAAHQAYNELATFTTDEVRHAALEFVHDLRAALRDRVDVLDYLNDERGRAAVLAGRN